MERALRAGGDRRRRVSRDAATLPPILVGDLVTTPTSALDALRDARHRILPSLPDRASAAALDRALAEVERPLRHGDRAAARLAVAAARRALTADAAAADRAPADYDALALALAEASAETAALG